MRIPCPYCGERDAQEFVYRGDARSARPDSDDDFHDYIYLRENPAGRLSELWYHSYGCRTWLVVDRDTRTHEIFGARYAQEVNQ